MLFKRKKHDDDLKLRGWRKFLYYMGRVLILPLRRPIITLLVLLILFLAPTFRGVKPIEVHKWYASQFYGLCNKVMVWWGASQPEVSPNAFQYKAEEVAPTPVVMEERKAEELLDKKAPNILDVLTGKEKTPVDESEKSDETIKIEPELSYDGADTKQIRLPQDESIYSYPQDKKVYSLKYLDFPHEVIGKAIVHNSNEIEINGEFILMYGIYVHPYTAQGKKATNYLKDMIENKEVKCGIVAYTAQNIATGICYLENENINRHLVIQRYSRNVAL